MKFRKYPISGYRDGSRRRARLETRRGFQGFGDGAPAGGAAGFIGSPGRFYGMPGSGLGLPGIGTGPGGIGPGGYHPGIGPGGMPGLPGAPGIPGPTGGGGPSPGVGPGWGYAGAAAAAARFARIGLRFVPWLGLIAIGYELWQFYKHHGGKWAFKLSGYDLIRDCNDLGVDRISTQNLVCTSSAGPGTAWDKKSLPSFLTELHDHGQSGGFYTTVRVWQRNALAFQRRPRWLPDRLFPIRPGVSPLSPEPAVQPMPWRPPYPAPPVSPFMPSPPNGEPDWFKPADPFYPWPSPEWPGWPGPGGSPLPSPPTPGPVLTPPQGPGPGPAPIPPGFSASPGRPVRRVMPRNRPRPPRPREKEKKTQMTPAATSLLGRALNWSTESADIIDAFWWALPPDKRTPPTFVKGQGRWVAAGTASRARDVWENWEYIDPEKAVKNIISNQIEDFIAGKAGKLTQKANRNLANSGYGRANLELGPAL